MSAAVTTVESKSVTTIEVMIYYTLHSLSIMYFIDDSLILEGFHVSTK
jgi:hypothetical protein